MECSHHPSVVQLLYEHERTLGPAGIDINSSKVARPCHPNKLLQILVIVRLLILRDKENL